MRNDFKAKEVQKIIDCGDQFIPAMTKKFYGHEKPIFEPSYKGGQGRASRFTRKDVLLLAVMYEARQFGLGRGWIHCFEKVLSAVSESKKRHKELFVNRIIKEQTESIKSKGIANLVKRDISLTENNIQVEFEKNLKEVEIYLSEFWDSNVANSKGFKDLIGGEEGMKKFIQENNPATIALFPEGSPLEPEYLGGNPDIPALEAPQMLIILTIGSSKDEVLVEGEYLFPGDYSKAIVESYLIKKGKPSYIGKQNENEKAQIKAASVTTIKINFNKLVMRVNQRIKLLD